jgi:hypothetical protein
MKRHASILTSTLLLLPLAGCMVQSRKSANGDDVNISTPLGGMSVKTDNATVQTKLGLPLYPGAVLETKKGNDKSSADVDMNFGAFHLRVLAMGFTTTDDQTKVSSFYRKALSQYSDVIACHNKQPIGTPVKTGLGLTCADDNKVHAGAAESDDTDETELKAGSPSRQHIVSFKAKDGGTRFGLVSLELPRSDDGKGA